MSNTQNKVIQLFAGQEVEKVPMANEEVYRHRPNKDLTGVPLKRRDAYSAIAYGFRFEFLLDSSTNEGTGREVYKIFPLKFQEVSFEEGRMHVNQNLFDVRIDERFYIPLGHVLGYGEIWDSPDFMRDETVDMYEEMVKVLQASIVRAVEWKTRKGS